MLEAIRVLNILVNLLKIGNNEHLAHSLLHFVMTKSCLH